MWSNKKPSNQTLSVAVAVGLATIPLAYYTILVRRRKKQNCSKKHASPSSALAAEHSNNNSKKTLKPPFPQVIRDMLSKCHLAYLSTMDRDAQSSHLSLMRFTYVHDDENGEIILMSTNRHTKKFDMLQKQKGVALLVHDFADKDKVLSTHSITLNGQCRILDDDKATTRYYRDLHLQHNPDYPQFIVGPNVAMLCVSVYSARICNIHDQVIHWNV